MSAEFLATSLRGKNSTSGKERNQFVKLITLSKALFKYYHSKKC